jgi:hypothetical protein
MTDIASLATGVLLGLWSTYRLERSVAHWIRHGCAPVRGLMRSALLRLTLIGVIGWALLAVSTTAPLLALVGFWIGRTVYLGATVVLERRIA